MDWVFEEMPGVIKSEVATAQLVEAGRLRFESRLSEAWPDCPNQAVAKAINIAQMLAHTSGLGEGLTPQIQRSDTPYRTLQEAIAVNAGAPLLFEPGSQWGYSNLGFMVLGRAVELLSGVSFEAYIEKNILTPAGMTETITTGKHRLSPDSQYGYGFWERGWQGRSMRGNGGGGLGYGINTEVNTIWTPGGEQTDWTFILLSNYDPPFTQNFSLAALRYLAALHDK
jgi:D-alanyl-D-alanine carboxypeptidase